MAERRVEPDEGPTDDAAKGAAAQDADDRRGARAPGWREVLIVAAIVVGAVFAIQVITSLLPESIQEIVFHTPLAIIVLVAGTLGLLLRIARRQSL